MRYLRCNDEVRRGDQFFDGASWGSAKAFIGTFVSMLSGKRKLFRRPPKRRVK